MVYLHAGSGSREIELLHLHFTSERWTKIRESARRLMVTRNQTKAVELLDKVPFELYNGTNAFGDEFTVLHATVELEQYTRIVTSSEKPEVKKAAAQLAKTVEEIGPFVRFVVVELDTDEAVAPVETPSLQISSESVVRALDDAAQLIRGKGGPVSAVDRVHTAMHGYLLAACLRIGIAVPKDETVAGLFKLIRKEHAAFQEHGPRWEDIRKISNSFGAILDALSPVRNQASIAHPNEALLGEAEAMLVINTVSTLLHFLDAKLS